MTTWIHGSEGVRWRGGRRVAVRQQDDAQVDQSEEGISQLGQHGHERIEATGAGQSEQLGGAQDLRQGGLAMGFVSGDMSASRNAH